VCIAVVGVSAAGADTGAATAPRYIVKSDGVICDMLAGDEWSVAAGIADLGMIGWIESDGDGGLVCICCAGAGSPAVIITVPQRIRGTDIDNDEDTDITPPPSTTGLTGEVLARIVRSTGIDADDDMDVVANGTITMLPGPG
jgi:hypothetical protein